MRHLILFFFLGGLFAHCANDRQDNGAPPASTADASTPETGPNIQVSGLLLCRDTIALLWSTKDTIMYRITDQTGTVVARHNEACKPVHYLSETTYAVLEGFKTALRTPGRTQKITITKVDSVVTKTPANIGLPFAFWCFGTDADWDIEICNLEGGIFYQNTVDGTGWFCPWTTPTEQGNKWTYNIPASLGTTEPMTLVIKKEKVSDAKSGKTYDYAVDLTVKGKKWKGGAIRGTASLMEGK